jgi:hypothetical protein
MPLVTTLWNRFVNRAPPDASGIALGYRVGDGQVSRSRYILPHSRRAEHMVILGKTGTGKTSLIKSMLAHDIRNGHGFLCIDLHGDLGPFILGRVRQRELRTGEDLGYRTVIVDPADPQCSVGLNILRTHGSLAPLISEVVSIFRRRWQLDRFGARTEELLRNSLWVLAENGMTLLELAPFLTDLGFRAPLIECTQNAEVKAYFRSRYEQLSDAMQTVVREAILNKASAFTTDPAIRHIVGQHTAFELSDALERGQWVILQIDKSRLGEDAEVLASLILARFKNAIFARKARTLVTLYADEVQNLVSSGDTFEHLLSEARKFGVSVVTANQHLGQYSPQVRATLLSAGTTLFFRASPEDAPYIARSLDGGQAVERLLKELPNRHFLVRSGGERWVEVKAEGVAHNTTSTADLIAQSNAHWAKPRAAIEAEIASRRPAAGKEALEEWA